MSYGGGGSPSPAVGELVFRLGKFMDGEYSGRPIYGCWDWAKDAGMGGAELKP